MTRWRISETTAFVAGDPRRGVVFALDQPRTQPLALLGSGATIWSALAGQDDDLRPWHEETELLSRIAETHGVTASLIGADVTDFLAQMKAAGYIESEA